MATLDGFPASFYGEPGVLGMLANGISAFLVLLQNFNTARTGVSAEGVENILAGVHLILIGGVCQLIAGLLSFRKYDHLSGTAFIGYAALWGSYGATRIFLGASQPITTNLTISHDLMNNTTPLTALTTNLSLSAELWNSTSQSPDWLSLLLIPQSAIAGLVPYILLSFLLAFCSATVNVIMPFVFGAITLTLLFEAVAVGVSSAWPLVVSGILELLILLFAVYGSAALLPCGQRQSLGQEKKKNTKYAEPQALFFFCDTVSPFIMLFYSFGYVTSFSLGAVWVSIISAAQLLSSYYAHLRQDGYLVTKAGLHATYWLTKAWEEFVLSAVIVSEPEGEVATGRQAMVGDWFFVAVALLLLVVSLSNDTLEVTHNALFLLLSVSTVPQIPLQGYYVFFGVSCSLFASASLYGTFCRLINSIAEKSLIPVGPQPISSDRLLSFLSCFRSPRKLQGALPSSSSSASSLTNQIPDALFYLTNGVAALSALHAASSSQSVSFLRLSVPWVLVSGAVVQGFVSRLQVRGGQRFGSVIPSFYLSVWATWTWYRFAGPLLQISPVGSYGFTAGAIAFLVINAFLMLIAAYGNLVLLSLTVVMEAVLVCFLLSTLQQLPYQLEIAMLAVFSVVCLYGTLASLVNGAFRQSVMPMGPPLVKDVNQQQKSSPALPCPVADSRLTSGLLKISRLLDDGGLWNPHRYGLRPGRILVEQLVAAKPPFSSLLWEFMRNVYPGGISCIVSKGDWLLRLGVGPAYDRVGTNDSIMIRVPDHTVTGHLCDITGPLAITSANPSGEPDSTHHDMVISRLGHKIQGVLCDGDSNEIVASTVVNCLKIDEGTISIVREGCVPAVKVRQIFERVKTSMS
ncbi:uncharacterized protein LOC135545386 [Oncorhynchus masou masou]|uniref:uncharacterized protein LOC135545386 n=1 Tax=Oncorhynchus masou masou TaxID=90313 RepID=UPI0031830D13